MKKLAIPSVLFLLFAWACYEDKGNYDYNDIMVNKITIRYPVYSVSVYLGDPVVFTPTLTYANKEQADTNIYTWEYHFNYLGLVCTERNMNKVFEEVLPGRSYDGIVIATDTTTGAKYTQNIGFTYRSPYVVGYLLLANEGGKSKLHLLRELNGNWSKVEDLYRVTNNAELGTNPTGMDINRRGRKEVRVMQDGPEGAIVLSGDSYQRVCTYGEEFLGGTLPAGFKPKAFSGGGNVAAMLGENGTIYTKTFSGVYASELFAPVPCVYGTTPLDVQYLLMDAGYMYSPYVYDRNTSSFYLLYGASYYYAGTFSPIRPPEGWSDPVVPPPNDLSDYEIVAARVKPSDSYDVTIVAMLKKRASGELFVYTISHGGSGSPAARASTLTLDAFTAASSVDANTMYHFLQTRPYFFFTGGSAPSKLYCYDLRTKSAWEFKDYGSRILAMESNYTNDNALCVALENGEVYVEDIQESTFISGEGKVIFNASLPGKVVDIDYKDY
ncbi:MAG: hypothetical protein LBP56_01105 [Odoribacteraceae bacterium]|jgi:hypothetical protein|nr:hypothetical protein [Odoribacteraceae bacterium]